VELVLLAVATLLSRHLPDVDATDTVSSTAAAAILAGLEQTAARWLGFPVAPSAAGGAAVGSTWESRAYVLFPRSRDGERLIVPLAPITTITSVYSSASADWPEDGSVASDAVAVTSSDYTRDVAASCVILQRRASSSAGIWLRGARQTRVVCTAGYTNEAALPLGVADALYLAAADQFNARRTRIFATSSQGGGSQSYRDLAALPPDVMSVLAPYRLVRVRRLGDAAAELRAAASGGLRAALRKALLAPALEGEGLAKGNATTSPKVRSGVLRRSIQGSVELEAEGVKLALSAGREGSPSERYADVQELGETIKPRKGRFLAIPVGAALTASGVARFRSPRDVGDLRFQPIRGGAMGLLVRDHAGRGKSGRGARSEVLFVLVRSVRVPATRFLGRAMDEIRPKAEEAVRAALGGDRAD
jgi:hypothetical protein